MTADDHQTSRTITEGTVESRKLRSHLHLRLLRKLSEEQ